MESTNKSNKVTAQAVSEVPGPICVSSDAPGLTRRSSYDWTNNEKRVVLRAPCRSVNATGDQSVEESEGEVGGGKERRRRTKKKNRGAGYPSYLEEEEEAAMAEEYR